MDIKKVSYGLGMGIGQQLKSMGGADLSIADLAKAIGDILADKEPEISHREAQELVSQYFKAQEEKLNAEKAVKGKQAKTDGEKFLADNAQKEGVHTTKSGLQYKVLREGNGKSPKATDSVRCHYEGMLIDGTLFDSSLQRGEPATFGLNQVIAGWTEGLQLMKEGGKYRFFIPYMLGYGESGAGSSIPPFSTLIFDVELLQVVG
jgi:FKBP-type peptidyl-prolyl cis-trans isomerase FklB